VVNVVQTLMMRGWRIFSLRNEILKYEDKECAGDE
jgi:hypothetical protein